MLEQIYPVNGQRKIPGINIKELIETTLTKQNIVTTFLDKVKNTIAAEICK